MHTVLPSAGRCLSQPLPLAQPRSGFRGRPCRHAQPLRAAAPDGPSGGGGAEPSAAGAGARDPFAGFEDFWQTGGFPHYLYSTVRSAVNNIPITLFIFMIIAHFSIFSHSPRFKFVTKGHSFLELIHVRHLCRPSNNKINKLRPVFPPTSPWTASSAMSSSWRAPAAQS